jgi:hypothetical protein
VSVGGNIYFDTMKSRNDNRYNQIGLGVEARSQWVDVIMNGCIVAGDELNFIAENDLYSLNNMSLAVNKGAEQSMPAVTYAGKALWLRPPPAAVVWLVSVGRGWPDLATATPRT